MIAEGCISLEPSVNSSPIEWVLITTPYFWSAMKFLALAGVIILSVKPIERWSESRTRAGDFSLSPFVRNARYWRNALVLYLLANAVASLSGGMGNIVLSYIGGYVLLFTFFRTIDRELSLGDFARGAVRTAEATLYIAFTLALANDVLFPSL